MSANIYGTINNTNPSVVTTVDFKILIEEKLPPSENRQPKASE